MKKNFKLNFILSKGMRRNGGDTHTSQIHLRANYEMLMETPRQSQGKLQENVDHTAFASRTNNECVSVLRRCWHILLPM